MTKIKLAMTTMAITYRDDIAVHFPQKLERSEQNNCLLFGLNTTPLKLESIMLF